MKSLKQLPTIANVAAGNNVSIMLPVGNTYEAIHLHYSGVTAAQLKNIKIEANNRLISEYPSGTRLISMDSHYSRTQKSGVLIFNFNRPELHKLGDTRFFGFDTNRSQGITTANISIEIDAAASAPVLTAYAQTVQSVQGVPNYLTKVRRMFVNVSAAGTFEIDNIPKPVGASIAAIHLYMPDVGDENSDGLCEITKAELLVDNTNWHDLSASKAAVFQQLNGRTPQVSDSTVIDLILDGDVQHALPLSYKDSSGNQLPIQDMRLRCEAASAGQVELMVEYIDVWGAGRF
ncbi:major capsid protein P2 [Colwellia sp. E2M01]|uniref:major capsid protein P2 n=1 Tax=Colwellia sp. E2M01 TaxID=2841561 RepID=UPI001C098B5F|nr:major capsid protein P2 [Colwellia sp. E2M01]MBU2871974.1 hypothetical protein [Colwellia sp. E2M01]